MTSEISVQSESSDRNIPTHRLNLDPIEKSIIFRTETKVFQERETIITCHFQQDQYYYPLIVTARARVDSE